MNFWKDSKQKLRVVNVEDFVLTRYALALNMWLLILFYGFHESFCMLRLDDTKPEKLNSFFKEFQSDKYHKSGCFDKQFKAENLSF